METDRIKFCCDCTNKNCPEEMPDPNSMACSFFIGKENVCKNCKHFAPKTTHCKKGVPWISEDDSCNNFEQKPKMTVFQQITESPETLAKMLVIPNYSGRGYFSIIIDEGIDGYGWYRTYEEAIAATVAKLKEVVE